MQTIINININIKYVQRRIQVFRVSGQLKETTRDPDKFIEQYICEKKYTIVKLIHFLLHSEFKNILGIKNTYTNIHLSKCNTFNSKHTKLIDLIVQHCRYISNILS